MLLFLLGVIFGVIVGLYAFAIYLFKSPVKAAAFAAKLAGFADIKKTP